VSSALLSLYSVTKVLSQIWGPPFFPPPRAGGHGGPSSGSARNSPDPKSICLTWSMIVWLNPSCLKISEG